MVLQVAGSDAEDPPAQEAGPRIRRCGQGPSSSGTAKPRRTATADGGDDAYAAVDRTLMVLRSVGLANDAALRVKTMLHKGPLCGVIDVILG